MRHLPLLVGAGLLCASNAASQEGGLGAPIVEPGSWGGASTWDVQAAATNGAGFQTNALLGVVHNPVKQETYVTSRRDTSRPFSAHLIFVFDKQGKLVATVNQHANQNGSAWGARDMAWNKSTSSPMFYLGGGDPTGQIPGAPAEIYPFDGTLIGTPIPLPTYPHDVARAIAYCEDPSGNVNGGSHYFAITDFSGMVSLHDVATGSQIKTINSFQESCFGLAWNPLRDTLIAHGQGPTTSHPNGAGSMLSEAHADGSGTTGSAWFGDLSVTIPQGSSSLAGGIAGGVSGWVDAGGRYHLVALQQGLPSDVVYHHDGQFQFGSCAGFNGAISMSGRAFETQSAFRVKVAGAGAGATQALLFIGLPNYPGLSVPAAVTCPFYPNLVPFAATVGPQALSAGAADSGQLTLPTGIAGVELAFQWLLLGATPSLPFDLSDAGSVYVTK